MNFFEEATLRLKQQLQVKTDKEVAKVLGLSAVAWVGRKKRNNFPEVELYALAAKRPDLKINVEYVLTGRAPQSMTPEGRDNYLAGELTALKVMVQALFRHHPKAEEARGYFLQEIKALEGALASESLPEDYVRGLRSGEKDFRLLPSAAAESAARPPTEVKAKHTKKAV